MSDERKILICMRRSWLPHPPVKSRLGRCALCNERIWISASSPECDEFRCVPCANDLIELDDKAAPLTEAQLADIARARS